MSPTSIKLIKYNENLTKGGFNVVDTIPKTYSKPVVLIGEFTNVNVPHKNGLAFMKSTINVHYYRDVGVRRTDFEDEISLLKSLLKENDIEHTTRKDTTFGKTLYHVVIKINTYIV